MVAGGAGGVVAVLDACVLYPAALRDTLLRAAEAGLYQPRWSPQLLEELVRNLLANRPPERPLTPDRAAHLLEALREAFPEAAVTGHERLIGRLTNHPKDRHVLAAAVHAQAPVLVTSNLRDFPAWALAPYGVEAQSPDQFLTGLFLGAPDRTTRAVVAQAAALTRPPRTPGEVLDALAPWAPEFVARVRPALPGPP